MKVSSSMIAGKKMPAWEVLMRRLCGIGFALALAPMSYCQAKNGVQTGDPSSFTISIEGPAYANEPIWVRALNGPIENVRYPFYPAIDDFGCNKLEVRHDGALLTPRTIPAPGGTLRVGIACGSSAPAGSPQGRLPLHIVYALSQPGTYSVRWTIEAPGLHRPVPLRAIAESQWFTFTVLAETPKQHEKWVRQLLANPPKDPGQLAGDFIPSLVADAPDRRALSALLHCLYADNQVVAGEAASALELFPQSEVMRAVVGAIEEHGPSDQLAYYATVHKGWTLADEDGVVRAAVRYLNPPHMRPVAEVNQPENPFKPLVPTAMSAAIKLLGFIFHTPNHAWPADSNLNAWTDAQVLRAAPTIMASADTAAVQELAEFLGSMQPFADAHELLLRIADRDDVAGEQAKICLGWHRPN